MSITWSVWLEISHTTGYMATKIYSCNLSFDMIERCLGGFDIFNPLGCFAFFLALGACLLAIFNMLYFWHWVLVCWQFSTRNASSTAFSIPASCHLPKQARTLCYHNALDTGVIGPSWKVCAPSNMADGLADEVKEDEQLVEKADEVTITHSISLTFNGSKPVPIPSPFLVKDCKGLLEEKSNLLGAMHQLTILHVLLGNHAGPQWQRFFEDPSELSLCFQIGLQLCEQELLFVQWSKAP